MTCASQPELIGKNGELRHMWSLEQMVEDSYNWD